MKIVNIAGGLGNQMFQYALALSLKNKLPNERILIDTTSMNGYNLHNGYELKRIFNIDIPEASIKEQISLYYPFRNWKMWKIGKRILPSRKNVIWESFDKSFNPSIISRESDAYYIGYWQSEKYFKDIRNIILESFKFPEINPDDINYNSLNTIKSSNSLSVHVRRGDYLKIKETQQICDITYYKKAINFIKEKTNPELYVIFSDDINWCKNEFKNLSDTCQTIFVDWNKGKDSYKDMQLMSTCKHNIIANSSFSWWGAWLNQNPNKIVIAPQKWMNGEGWLETIPDDWYKI